MKAVNVSELEGAALDWAVSIAVDEEDIEINNGYAKDRSGNLISHPLVINCVDYSEKPFIWQEQYAPSSDWAQLGSLIQQCFVRIDTDAGGHWWALCNYYGQVGHEQGNDPLAASCRAIVAAKLGSIIEVPEELL